MPRGTQVPASSPSSFAYVAITLYGRSFQSASTRERIGNSTVAGPTTPPSPEGDRGLGYIRFRSPLLSESRLISFPSGTEMVHFPELARVRLWIHRTVQRVYRWGFPHSEIPGSKPACGSPRLIAACHVLHRHLPPRHPPCALSSLTIKFTQHSSPCGLSHLANFIAPSTHRKRILRSAHTSRYRHS